jgi:hypothetical protein
MPTRPACTSAATSAPTSRRRFLHTTAGLAAGLALGPVALASRRRHRDSRLRVLSIGVVGTIGGTDRWKIHEHPNADIVGLCDVDDEAMAEAVEAHPGAFTLKDYREAFDRHADKFDAVIVATPDHAHASMMTMALARGKHVYGQKPLVQQLEELDILQRAVDARPGLVTQTGAQRIQSRERRAAYHLLKSNALGRVIEVHVAFGSGAHAGGHYFADGTVKPPCDPPEGFDYDLWLNGAAYEPCRPEMVRRQWRSWWNFGGGQIADWVVHLTDVVFNAYPELSSPSRVCSQTPWHDVSIYHAQPLATTLTYDVDSPRFAATTCNFYFYDTGITPSRALLGLPENGPDEDNPEGKWPGSIFTVVVCEGGTMVLGPSGPLQIWRDGKMTDGLSMPGLPAFDDFNHWHAWVDRALGVENPNLWCPFDLGLRCTEAGLLSVKSAKYPGQVLEWDRASLRFTNHADATRTIVRREYRSGFEPVRL